MLVLRRCWRSASVTQPQQYADCVVYCLAGPALLQDYGALPAAAGLPWCSQPGVAYDVTCGCMVALWLHLCRRLSDCLCYVEKGVCKPTGPENKCTPACAAFLEKMGQFNREKTPERVVHARGMVAKGEFEVSLHLVCPGPAAYCSMGNRGNIMIRACKLCLSEDGLFHRFDRGAL